MFSKSNIHPTWEPIVHKALSRVSPEYLEAIDQTNWLPGPHTIFNAFSLPLNKVKYILFGESPYPREISANGYAFWDAAVTDIWSDKGLSKAVNRATSLRNFIKMLLIADGRLTQDTSQPAIAHLSKSQYVKTLPELFNHLLNQGFLLLNASLTLSKLGKNKDAKAWFPFMGSVLSELQKLSPNIELILFGKIAESIQKIPASNAYKQLISEHPYNISFIHNPEIIEFFMPFKLLNK